MKDLKKKKVFSQGDKLMCKHSKVSDVEWDDYLRLRATLLRATARRRFGKLYVACENGSRYKPVQNKGKQLNFFTE